MNTIHYYRARCGSIYRVTTTEATGKNPARCMQARKGPKCRTFSPEYPTTAEEVARMVRFKSFIEIPDPCSQQRSSPSTTTTVAQQPKS